jgi:hypothetical protein
MAKDLKKLAALTQKRSTIVTRGVDAEQHINQSAEQAAQLGLQSYFGWIILAGPNSDGTFHVEFAIPGNGWVSNWPQWAYEAAVESLLHRKKLWVISEGIPFGENLVQVVIVQEDEHWPAPD